MFTYCNVFLKTPSHILYQHNKLLTAQMAFLTEMELCCFVKTQTVKLATPIFILNGCWRLRSLFKVLSNILCCPRGPILIQDSADVHIDLYTVMVRTTTFISTKDRFETDTAFLYVCI